MSHFLKFAGVFLLCLAFAGVILTKSSVGMMYQEWVLEVVRDACLLLGLAGAAALALGYNWYPLKWRLPTLRERFPNFFPRW